MFSSKNFAPLPGLRFHRRRGLQRNHILYIDVSFGLPCYFGGPFGTIAQATVQKARSHGQMFFVFLYFLLVNFFQFDFFSFSNIMSIRLWM